MHELAIAQSIVEAAKEEADKAGAQKVTSIEVDVGELMQLDVEALEGSLKMFRRDPRLKDMEVRVRTTRASFSCNKCGRTWGMAEARKQLEEVADELRVREPDSIELPLHFLPYLYPSFVRCPGCGSTDSDVEGEDVVVRRVVLE